MENVVKEQSSVKTGSKRHANAVFEHGVAQSVRYQTVRRLHCKPDFKDNDNTPEERQQPRHVTHWNNASDR